MKLTEREKWLIKQVFKAASNALSKDHEVQEFEWQRFLHNFESRLAADAPDGWMSVDERLPEESEEVLGYKHGVGLVLVRAVPSGWVETWDDADIKGITHWMPLPLPPQDK